MEAGLREVCRSVRIGKILIQRVRLIMNVFRKYHKDVFSQDEETAQAKLFYAKVGLIASNTMYTISRQYCCSFLKTLQIVMSSSLILC